MTVSAIETLILDMLTLWGLAVLAILSAVLIVSVAYLIFNFGWKTGFKGETSIISSHVSFLDHVPFVKPYRGFKRYRSTKWNMDNTMY